MNTQISFILQNDVLIVSTQKGVYQCLISDKRFGKLKEAIANQDEALIDSLMKTQSSQSSKKQLLPKFGCHLSDDGTLLYNGEEVDNVIANKIRDYIDLDLPHEPLMRFMENLMDNPSKRSVDQLYSFLEHKNLPITDDGCFLAYKAVRSTLYDKHSNTILNEIGSVISVPRNKVDDNPQNHCSHGLHCGSLEYIKWFARDGDKILVVKVNPKNVVSIPSDHSCTKLRTCEYTVLSYYDKPLSSLYSPSEVENFRYEKDDEFSYDDNNEKSYNNSYDELEECSDFICKNGKLWKEQSCKHPNVPNPTEHEKSVSNWQKRDASGRFCK